MIAFGTSITEPDIYDERAAPGIRLAAETDSKVIAMAAAGSIFRSYNLILDEAAKHEDLEALVLLHQDTEIVDAAFCANLREALADPDVAVVGCIGAVGVRSIAWWEGSVTWASFSHAYEELGGGEFESFSWEPGKMPAYARTGEVDTIDGFLMCLSPWAVRNLRFDESLGQLHGYDFDFCLQARAAGKKVVTANLRTKHHHSLTLVGEPETWIEAHMRVSEKWDGKMPEVGKASLGTVSDDWRERARRAEAEAAAYRLELASIKLKHDARIEQLEREFNITVGSISWKITEPLRRLNARRRTLARPVDGTGPDGMPSDDPVSR